jgi:hypothetical protein
MRQNKISLVEGKTYIIDEGFNNSGEVELIAITGDHFCIVKDLETGGEWTTSQYRLSEIKINHL